MEKLLFNRGNESQDGEDRRSFAHDAKESDMEAVEDSREESVGTSEVGD
jgi:hypothetical protein